MAAATLTDARVRAIKPRKTARDIRDGKLKGFGVRVMPSGTRRWFVHCQHDGRRVWKTVGDASATGADEARARSRDQAGRPAAGLAGRDGLRGRRRGNVPQARTGLEAAHDGGEPRLPAQADPATVRRTPGRRHHPGGRRAVVRLAAHGAGGC